MQGAATAQGSALTEAVLAGAAKLLADLAERGVVRGPCDATVACSPEKRPG